MKLLLYSHFFAPSTGGVETIVMSLARGLAEVRSENGQRAFDVTLVTQTPKGNFDDDALPFPVARQPGFWRLWRLIKKADVVHLAGPSLVPMLLAWLVGKPYVIEHHSYQSICPNGLLLHQPERSICPGHFQARHYGECFRCQSKELGSTKSIAAVLEMFPRHWLSKRAVCNIAVTEHVQYRISLPRTSVIYHGIDAPRDSSPRLNVGAAKEPVSFAYVGRFVQEKGISVFLSALGELQKQGFAFKAKLIGDGPERAHLEAQIGRENLESRVSITGFLKGAEFAAEVADVSVIVMPSVWEETAGLAAMEQMMRGRVVICSEVGGLGEIVGEAGLKFPPGDEEALYNRFREVIEDPSLQKELGSKASLRAREFFSLQRMVTEHASLYGKLAQKHHSGRV